MRRPLPLRPSVALLVVGTALLAGGLAACSSDGGDTADGESIAGLLQAVPDTKANQQYVVVNRYDAAAEGAEVETEGGGETDQEMDRLLQLSRQAGIVPTGVVDATMGAQRVGALGFPPSKVVATVSAGNPPDAIDLAVVDADEADVLDAAGKVEGSKRTEVDGVDVVRWLDDHEVDADLDTPIGQVPGQAGRVAFIDGGLLATSTSDAVEAAAIATAKGDDPSLMDDEGIAAVADALDEEDAFTAFISGVPLRAGSRSTPQQGDDQTPRLQEYTAIALGNAWTDDGLELVIAVAHDDDAQAKANAAALKEAASDGTSAETAAPLSDLLGDPHVERDGTTVIGTFHVERPAL
ncbi:MAG: DUF3352 domain-containing protein [Aquihabitans sp.]